MPVATSALANLGGRESYAFFKKIQLSNMSTTDFILLSKKIAVGIAVFLLPAVIIAGILWLLPQVF